MMRRLALVLFAAALAAGAAVPGVAAARADTDRHGPVSAVTWWPPRPSI